MLNNVNWKGDEFFDDVEKEMQKRLNRAGIHLKNKIQEDLSVGVTRIGGTVTGRSQPGDPPALEEGELRRSMTHVLANGSAFVGTNKVYGKFLELGTKEMRPRPFLRSGLNKNRKAINRILTEKL